MSKTEFTIREDEAIKDLIDVKNLLDDNNLKFWLMSGTLLGCMARGEFLPGDRDIDIGMWGKERNYFSKLKPDLEKLGFIIKERFDPVEEELKGIVTIQRSDMPMDIKFYQHIDNYAVRAIHKSHGIYPIIVWEVIDILYFKKFQERSILRQNIFSKFFGYLVVMLTKPVSGSTRNEIIKFLSKSWRNSKKSEYGKVVFPDKYFLTFEEKLFFGYQFRVPGYVEEYLTDEYGADWNEDNPTRKGGWDKKSHIVHKKNRNEYDLSDKDMISRHKVIGYVGS